MQELKDFTTSIKWCEEEDECSFDAFCATVQNQLVQRFNNNRFAKAAGITAAAQVKDSEVVIAVHFEERNE